MVNIEITKMQSKQFADVIFNDIENYIKTHQEEYNEFLKEEERNVKTVGTETVKKPQISPPSKQKREVVEM